MPFVVDTSALVWATTETAESAVALRARLASDTVHAPHLVDAEFGNVLRRKVLRGELAADHATSLLQSAPNLIDLRYPHRGGLAAMAWSLRDNVTFYDALYVALATALDVVLVTADERLVAAPRLPCRVEMAAVV